MVQLSQILSRLKDFRDVRLLRRGDVGSDTLITGPKNIEEALPENICFLSQKYKNKVHELLLRCKASLIILDESLKSDVENLPTHYYIFISPNAKKTILELSKEFFYHTKKPVIHPTAIIEQGAMIGKNTYIGPYTYIESGAVIKDNCFIGSHVYISSSVRIGNNVTIKPHAVIGGDGFGFVKGDLGSYEQLPHFGCVFIEDDVYIGSCTCIDRGTFGDTYIRKGVKIDNLVHIAHNVDIGENTLVIASSMIAGSVKIGKDCWIAPCVAVRNGLQIGQNAFVGLGSVVVKPVDSGATVMGVPAKPLEK